MPLRPHSIFVYRWSIVISILLCLLGVLLYVRNDAFINQESFLTFLLSVPGCIGLVLCIIGFTSLASNIGFVFSEYRYKKIRAYLIKNGIRRKARVVDIITNGMRGTTEFDVVAKKISDSEDTYTTYTSDPIAYTPHHIVQKGDAIFIYEDRENPTKYIVDTDSLFQT